MKLNDYYKTKSNHAFSYKQRELFNLILIFSLILFFALWSEKSGGRPVKEFEAPVAPMEASAH